MPFLPLRGAPPRPRQGAPTRTNRQPMLRPGSASVPARIDGVNCQADRPVCPAGGGGGSICRPSARPLRARPANGIGPRGCRGPIPCPGLARAWNAAAMVTRPPDFGHARVDGPQGDIAGGYKKAAPRRSRVQARRQPMPNSYFRRSGRAMTHERSRAKLVETSVLKRTGARRPNVPSPKSFRAATDNSGRNPRIARGTVVASCYRLSGAGQPGIWAACPDQQ
jgi:hypothetical protein